MKEKTITVRIDNDTNTMIDEISRSLSKTKKDILKEAVKHYKKELFFKQVSREFGELRNNRKEWESELKEREDWESTIGDDLD